LTLLSKDVKSIVSKGNLRVFLYYKTNAVRQWSFYCVHRGQ